MLIVCDYSTMPFLCCALHFILAWLAHFRFEVVVNISLYTKISTEGRANSTEYLKGFWNVIVPIHPIQQKNLYQTDKWGKTQKTTISLMLSVWHN